MDSREIALCREYEVRGVIDIDLLDKLRSETAGYNYSKLEKFCHFLELRLSDFRVVNCGLKLLDDERFQNELQGNSSMIQVLRERIESILGDDSES